MPYGQYQGLRLLSHRSGISARLAKHREKNGRAIPLAAPAKAAAVAKHSRPATPSAAAARQAVVETPKARATAVMASQAFKGRERQGEELLMASCARNAKVRSSAQVIAELSKRCSDAELARRTKARAPPAPAASIRELAP